MLNSAELLELYYVTFTYAWESACLKQTFSLIVTLTKVSHTVVRDNEWL